MTRHQLLEPSRPEGNTNISLIHTSSSRNFLVWWLFGAGSDQYPCHLSCWINLIYHLNDLPAQFGRVTSSVNHFSFTENPNEWDAIQTWVLDLKFENDRVTCFGHRTAMNCSLFDQDLANTCQIHQNTPIIPNHLSSQISTGWMHLEINAALLAYWHFPNVTFTRRCVDPSLAISSLPPSSPNTKPSPLQGRWRCHAPNWGSSELKFCIARPRPDACQETHHMTWETYDEAHSTHVA